MYIGKSQKAHSTYNLRKEKSSMKDLSFSQMWLILKTWKDRNVKLARQFNTHTQTIYTHTHTHIHILYHWTWEKNSVVIEVQEIWGLPWWRSGWESACQCRGHGFESWSGKIPHAADQLGLWATTAEPVHLEPVLRNKRGCDGERPAHRDEEWPPLASTRGRPGTETKTQHSQKIIINK